MENNIEKKLGDGHMGDVYKIKDAKKNKKRAIKMGDKKNVTVEEFKFTFFAGKFGVGPKCYVFNSTKNKEKNYIIMKYLKGKTLNLIDLDIDLLKIYMRKALNSYYFLLRNKIKQNDLKATNIIVTSEKKLFIIDYGIAKFYEHTSNEEYIQEMHDMAHRLCDSLTYDTNKWNKNDQNYFIKTYKNKLNESIFYFFECYGEATKWMFETFPYSPKCFVSKDRVIFDQLYANYTN